MLRLTLLDDPMRELDDAALAGQIQADPSLADTVLILLVSRGQQAAAAAAQVAGWLVKPVRTSQRMTVLQRR